MRALPLLAGLATLGLSGGSPSSALISALVAALLLVVAVLMDRSRMYLLWATYILGTVVFSHLRTLADETGILARYIYVIDIERLLFSGHVPTVWLQERLYELGNVAALDSVMVLVYLSYFVVPHALAIALAVWRREQFAHYVGAILATNYLGLVIFVLVPTGPPWLAAQEGHLPEVHRIVRDAIAFISIETYEQGNQVVGPNDVAAMPSLHFALTVVVVLAMRWFTWIHRLVAVAYAVLMGLALVYLGEHYVTDLLAGLVLAVAGWLLARWIAGRIAWRNRQPSQPI